MKLQFTDYAHSSYERSEQVDYFVDEFGWDEEVAEKYTHTQNPMYEVKAEFEYDTETNKLTVLSATVEGVRLTPNGAK